MTISWPFNNRLVTCFLFFQTKAGSQGLVFFSLQLFRSYFLFTEHVYVCMQQAGLPMGPFFQSICLHCDYISRCPMSFPNTDIPVQCWLHQYSAFSLVSPVQPAHEPSVAITEEEERKCQPVQTQNTEKVNIVEHAAMIHRDFKSLIFHLLTKIVMRTENGTTLIHLCDKHHNEGGSVQASNIHFTDLWSLFCNGTQTPTAHLGT